MNFGWLLANGALVVRYLKLLSLLPAILAFIQVFERKTSWTGAEKRAAVLAAIDATTDVLQKRGLLSADLNIEIDGLAGELIDAVVEVFNNVGIFKRKS